MAASATTRTTLNDTPVEAKALVTMILDWEKERKEFLSNPSSTIGECIDFIEDADLTPLVRTMQSRISASGSISEASVIIMFRMLDSLLDEYKMRTMSRSDYFADAVDDQIAHIERLQASMDKYLVIMQGNDSTQR